MPPRATSPSGCGAAYIWNPRTRRCVLRTGDIGLRLLGLLMARHPAEVVAPAPAPLEARPCRTGQVRNPTSGRCVSRGGNIGRGVRLAAGNVLTPRPARVPRNTAARAARAAAEARATAEARADAEARAARAAAREGAEARAAARRATRACPPNQVRNPASGRCVSRSGDIGRRVRSAAGNVLTPRPERRRIPPARAPAAVPAVIARSPAVALRPATPVATPTMNNLENQCLNDGDPVILEDFKNMNANSLRSIVKIGPGPKKHCFLLDSIFQVYKTAVLDNLPVKNPLNPSYILTAADINMIDRMMLARDPSYRPPQRTMMNYRGYELDITPDGNYFRLRIMRRGTMAMDLGYIPGDIETRNTGSADTTSAAMIAALRELWDQRRMLRTVEPLRVVGMIHLRKAKDFWRGADRLNKFRELMGEIRRFMG